MKLEYIQEREMKIIYGTIPYTEALIKANIEKLASRRESLTKKFFNKVKLSNSKLHYLLPDESSQQYSLRHNLQYKLPLCKTEIQK